MSIQVPSDTPVIQVSALKKTFGSGQSAAHALRGISATFPRGSFTAIMGPSGSGKSTFLQCTAGLERPTSGTVIIANEEISKLSEERLTILRRSRIGFVFQAFNLVPSLTAVQNIELPMRLAGKHPDKETTKKILRQVGLEDRSTHLPSQLSGGQQQRVAIARALAGRPEVLFADEPTGALDSSAGKQVMELIRDLVDTINQTVVMVTHDPIVASYADRVLFLVDGQLKGALNSPTQKAIITHMAILED